MKIKLSAVIPTVQYGNIQPEFEIDETDIATGKGFDYVEAKIQEIWNKYGERPLVTKGGTTKRLEAFVGGAIDYDEVNHVYSWNGEVYESGSQFAKKRQKPFDSVMMSGKVAKATGSDPLEIAKLWERGGKVSREFGTTVHEALEIYGKFKSLCDTLGKEYHLPNHPILKSIVEGFYEGREDEEAKYEVLVVDHEAKRAGTIDRLVLGNQTCIIQDFKITNKDDLEYWKDQLGFYEGILEAGGWKVSGKEIHKYNGSWKEIKV